MPPGRPATDTPEPRLAQTIADPEEIWHLEIVGKGKEKGAVWVARRVPDGYIGGHANQARITTFPHHDPEDTRFSKDLVPWAKRAGYYPADAAAEAFDFSAMANPISFHGARYGEVRVWDFFRRFLPSVELDYLQYVKGFELKARMPLWVKPTQKVTLNATFWAMRSHFEDTFFDMGSDVGAGPYGSMMRARPTSWHYKGVEYVNERPVAAQQTGWHFVAVMRGHLPNAVGGVSWYGVDDTSHGARIPVYCSATAVPAGWTRSPRSGAMAAQSSTSAYWVPGSTDEARFSLDSAWWVHNLVANLAYARWTAHADVTAEIREVEVEAFGAAAVLEAQALALLRQGRDDDAAQLLTEHTVRAGQALVARWLALWVRLVVKYRDGFVVWQNASKPNGDLASTIAQEVAYPESLAPYP